MKTYMISIFVVAATVSSIQVNAYCSGIACPTGYAYNPFACSCLRIIRERKTWDEAKAYCEGAGEYLAVLDSVESINWYKNLRMTDPDWRSSWAWIGGKKTGGKWQWFGRDQKDILLGDWEQTQPSPNLDDYCIHTFDGGRASNGFIAENFKWDDITCTSTPQAFVCEKF
ncbi:C-type lectin domain family 17, member A-like [Watersipora subatra]|uniref:C-type lectin domain family 17, member A-like n=1 Tax=Watersipora subatra TaxID=2589382 RepID=UPI00355BF43F